MDKKNKKEQVSEKIDPKSEKISTIKKTKKKVKKNYLWEDKELIVMPELEKEKLLL